MDLAGFAFVTRGKEYAVLDHPLVQARLHLPPDQFQIAALQCMGKKPSFLCCYDCEPGFLPDHKAARRDSHRGLFPSFILAC